MLPVPGCRSSGPRSPPPAASTFGWEPLSLSVEGSLNEQPIPIFASSILYADALGRPRRILT
jgi:hypothetical protein